MTERLEEDRINLGGRVYDRYAELRTDQGALDELWPRARVLPLAGSRLRVREDRLDWVDPGDAPDGLRVFLGQDDDGPRFAVIADAGLASGSDADRWVGLRGVVPLLGAAEASYVVHAVGLAEWHWSTRFCPRCGSPLEASHSGHVLHCPQCGRDQFPRTDPAVIMLVRDSADRVLLGRQPSWPRGRWSTLAGFVEPGESLEQAVRREVFEEAGVRVGRVDYFGSQPWPLPASLMLGFVAHAESTGIAVDHDEIEEARWFSREDALAAARTGDLLIPPGVSISRTLITTWYGCDLPGEWS